MSRNPSLIPGVTLPAHSIRAKTTNVRPTTEPASGAPMPCRDGCGACCIAPSITSPIPGMPHGKPAGMPCVQLDDGLRCRLFGKPERPAFCASLRTSMEMCGRDRGEALETLRLLELATVP